MPKTLFEEEASHASYTRGAQDSYSAFSQLYVSPHCAIRLTITHCGTDPAHKPGIPRLPPACAQRHHSMSEEAGSGAPEGMRFQVLKTSIGGGGARLGRLCVPNRAPIQTPAYVPVTSRGTVPHLTSDNLEKHTSFESAYMALEDCTSLTRRPHKTYRTTTDNPSHRKEDAPNLQHPNNPLLPPPPNLHQLPLLPPHHPRPPPHARG